MIASEKTKHSLVGIELVRLLAYQGDRIFSTARARELAPRVGLKDAYLTEALYHLRKNGWIVSLRRGLYAIAPTIPGTTPVHEFEIAMALVQPAAISHWSALHHHGLTEQVPRRIFVLTTTKTSIPRHRGNKRGREGGIYLVGDMEYRFVQVKTERFFGTERVWVGDARVSVTDLERTLLDGLAMPQHCGDFGEVLHAFEVGTRRLDVDQMIRYAFKLGPTVSKRLGWVLEHQGVGSSAVDNLAALPVKGYRKLDPTGPTKGPYNSRWMVQENLPGMTAA